MKYILATIFIIVSLLSFSQTDNKVLTIKSFEEKPDDLNFLSIQLPLWHLNGSPVNTSLYDLKGSFAYAGTKKLNGGIQYNWRLGDRLLPDTYERTEYVYQNMIYSKYKSAASKVIDFWANYFFTNKTKTSNESIELKRVGRTIYVTNVDVSQYCRTGINLGYRQGFTWYNLNNKPIILENTSTGVPLEFNEQSASTFQSFGIISAGLSFSKSVNFKVDIEDYGVKTMSRLNVSSFNLLFAVQNKFEDVLVGQLNTLSSQVEFIEYAFSDENKKLPIGFEFNQRNYVKSWGTFEYGIGYYPGLLKKINIGVHVGASIHLDLLFKHSI